ncbi:putative disease resistance protein RGA3 [Cinnamomum micranthum f. kanehirae]|uniref:Putative disease resistance protein RGA3 n=1 Tax=Cinnamomum micranthum f. kanehirae TaxID=337451 RepID=A0A3S3PXU7_9MAGN|nr:putative disease resistance protein RGA3 [Cinnamomum micranthum f. kanehirae]
MMLVKQNSTKRVTFMASDPLIQTLKELEIKNYVGSKFPSWLEDPRFSSLVKVVLENCRKCVLLPGLGKLHSLKYLEIIQADEVKVVGGEFYKNADARAKETGFPKLEKLHFESMLNWEEWKLKAMPSLKLLESFDCKKLKAMPSDGWGLLESLLTLTISCCPKLTSLPEGLGQLKALQTLQIRDCKRLSSLFDGFEQLKSLCRLDIWDCPQIRSLPNLQLLTALERLSIQRCPLLTERLEKEKGEDWCKISHIPRIHIDGGVE